MRLSLLPGAGLALLLATGCQSNPQATESAGSATTADSAATNPTGRATAPTGLYVRKNCNSPEAKADLEALAKALAIMKKLPCDDPRGWYYQGAMHNVPDSIATNPYCPQFTTGGMPLASWDGCTHGGGENHFLIWHRLYTLHFERIVRKLSGKADFAMPYWDYTNTQPGYRVMPAIFRTPADSLYENGRYAPLNHGAAIAASMDTALNVRTLNQNHTFALFNTNIDKAPHGAMHDYIGYGNLPDDKVKRWNRIYQRPQQGGLMGNVASAAFDPIFWVHHSNIDYLWAKWAASPRGRQPALAELEANRWQYQFFDENGKPANYTVAEAYEAALHPDYRYDVVAAATTKLLAAGAPAQQAPAVALATATVRQPITALTKFTAKLPVAAGQSKLLQGSAGKAQTQILLLQLSASFAKEPRGIYEVYVRDPRAGGAKPQLAGILNFFGAGHHHKKGAHTAMPGMDMSGAQTTQTFTFDITDEVAAGSFSGALDVQVVPKGTSARTPITIDKITLLTQTI